MSMGSTAAIWTKYTVWKPQLIHVQSQDRSSKYLVLEPVALLELSCPVNFPTGIALA
jgi:hypothetical protein